jgi:hypothetical protein
MLSSTLKPKRCGFCHSTFMPARPMQAVCSPVCARRQVAEKRVEERAQIVTRREALKTLPVLKAEAQKAFNAWVRARDAALPCISCGAPPPDLSQLHAGRDAGHYRSVGSAAHLRYHEDNVHAQCVHCNQFRSGNAVDYRIGLTARIGVSRVEALEADNQVRKFTADEIRAIRTEYKARLKARLKALNTTPKGQKDQP